MSNSSSLNQSKSVFTPSEMISMIDGQANAVLAGFGQLGFVQLYGILGPVKDSLYPIVYGVELRDSTGGPPMLINIPKSLKPEEYSGCEVFVGGFLQSRNCLKISLKVTKITPKIVINPKALVEDSSIRTIFSSPSLGPNDFPNKNKICITCICGKSSLVLDDFLNQIDCVTNDTVKAYGVNIDKITINITDPTAISEAIAVATGDVVVLMRGGGSDGDFAVFNRPQVLMAWRDLSAYKVSALGHSRNSTMLDRFSNRTCDTPTDAGNYVNNKISTNYRNSYKYATSSKTTNNDGYMKWNHIPKFIIPKFIRQCLWFLLFLLVIVIVITKY
jgi:hypothetical protein